MDAEFTLDSHSKKEIIENLAQKLRANYIFPGVAEQIAAQLEAYLQAGDYDYNKDGRLFSFKLNRHLQAVNHDEHLWVKFHPQPLPDVDGQLRLNQEWRELQRMEAEEENYGLHKVEILEGNIGYLDIHYFHRAEWGAEAVSDAMNALSATRALIIDLRQCPGGYPDMTTYISSYLFNEEPVLLGSIYWRDEDTTQEFWTLADLPTPRYLGKPVYILISQETFSAGEGFAQGLQILKRATLIGQKTDGGAHPGTSFCIHPHFEAFIPIGRAINPLTNDNWEGQGITPDILTSAEKAFEVAYQLALEFTGET